LAEPADVDFVYACNNDKLTRQNSYNPDSIQYSSHVSWYETKIQSPDSVFLIFTLLDTCTGIVRIDKVISKHIIGITIAPTFRGLGLAARMLRKSCTFYFTKTNATEITAFIKTQNTASYKAFLEAGFHLVETKLYNGSESYKMILKNERY
jgi:RimJ/RimL family protein N-acetyltransferase